MQWHIKSNYLKPRILSDCLIEPLSLVEMRVLQMAMADLRNNNTDNKQPKRQIRLHGSQYSHHFHTSRWVGYNSLKMSIDIASKGFSFQDNPHVRHEWVDDVSYIANEGVLALTFSDAVSSIMPAGINSLPEDDYVHLDINDSWGLNTKFALRLFEILEGWVQQGHTPFYDIKTLRGMMGVPEDNYPRISDFKKIVINSPLLLLEERFGWKTKIEQTKKGRNVTSLRIVVSKQSPP